MIHYIIVFMVRCQCLTLKGKQCIRTAVKGSLYCKQHEKCKTSITSMEKPIIEPQKVELIIAKKLTDEEQTKLNEALIVAATKGQLEIVQQLLKKGANVNAQNKYNETALL